MEYQFNKKAAKAFIKNILKEHALVAKADKKYYKVYQQGMTPLHKLFTENKINFTEFIDKHTVVKADYKIALDKIGSYSIKQFGGRFDEPSYVLTLTHILYNQLRHKRAHTKNDELYIISKDYQNLVERFIQLFPLLEDSEISTNTSCASE